jgi:hypothetical protein
MGAAISAGAAQDGVIRETFQCHLCGCVWRQQASAEEETSCPSWYVAHLKSHSEHDILNFILDVTMCV